jgi:hypothetical protein
MGKTMEAHYNGNVIRVSALRVPHKHQWTFTWVVWKPGAEAGVKTFTDYAGRFDTADDAISRGYDFAMKWIDDGKPDLLEER